MKVAVLVLLLAAAIGSEAAGCGVANYVCTGSHSFCLGGIVMDCAEGTKCTGSVNGQSPCTWDYPAAACPGPWEDYTCINKRAYCYGGVKVECKDGTACTGPAGPNCCEPILLDDNKGSGDACTGSACKPGEPASGDGSVVIHTCSNSDWKCLDDKNYCDGGHTYTCPGDTICKGKPPCVRRAHCKEQVKTCDSSGTKDWGCLNDSEFCHGGEVLGCPDGTSCTGSVNGSSPCTSDKASAHCGGDWEDWSCMNLKEYCVSDHVFTCADGAYCTGDGKGETSPCTTDYTPTTCPKGEGVCTSDNAFCQGGIEFFLPSDLVCKGTAPPVYEPDDSCDGTADNECLGDGKFCYGGAVYECTDGYSCTGSVDGKNPCTKNPPEPICSDWDDYSCVTANWYCLGGNAYKCAKSKPWCIGGGDDEHDPCSSSPPAPSCSVPDNTCLNTTTFCYTNISYNCPHELDCKGKSPFPCVYTEGECKPKPGPNPTPECTNPDWTCLDKRDYCYKGEILRCCDGSRCSNGKGCVEEKPPPVCPSGCVDYQCLDLEHFCLSGHAMSCPDGTKCTGKPGPQSPCRSDHKPVTCPKGEWGCTTVRSYCVEGVEFDCPFGAVCIGGKGPCVYPRPDNDGGYGS